MDEAYVALIRAEMVGVFSELKAIRRELKATRRNAAECERILLRVHNYPPSDRELRRNDMMDAGLAEGMDVDDIYRMMKGAGVG